MTAGALVALAILVYAALIEPYRMEIREVTIRSTPLARFFEDAVVVQLSDIHTAGIGLREKRLLAALHRLDPDYVLITGDFVQHEARRDGAFELLARIPAKRGVFGILGNVDYDGTRESCRMCHVNDPGGPLRGDDPITMLRNDAIVLERNGRSLSLVGLDEYDSRNGGPDPAKVLRDSARDLPTVVLAHTTFLIDEAAAAGADLYLAGDTHGGQIAAPTSILRRVMTDKHWDYRAGLFRVGGT